MYKFRRYLTFKPLKKQGRSSSIGAKILSFMLRQIMSKKKTLKNNLSNIENHFHILLNNNLNYFVCSVQLLYQCVLRNLFCFFLSIYKWGYLRGANQENPKSIFSCLAKPPPPPKIKRGWGVFWAVTNNKDDHRP